MRVFVILFVHVIATVAKAVGPGGILCVPDYEFAMHTFGGDIDYSKV
jgi:hypothetical protein